jgi:hypothetical protein
MQAASCCSIFAQESGVTLAFTPRRDGFGWAMILTETDARSANKESKHSKHGSH